MIYRAEQEVEAIPRHEVRPRQPDRYSFRFISVFRQGTRALASSHLCPLASFQRESDEFVKKSEDPYRQFRSRLKYEAV